MMGKRKGPGPRAARNIGRHKQRLSRASSIMQRLRDSSKKHGSFVRNAAKRIAGKSYRAAGAPYSYTGQHVSTMNKATKKGHFRRLKSGR